MHCVLNYPTKYEDANLNYIKILKKKFPGYIIGYSDHTNSDNSLTSIRVAHELGGKIVEKRLLIIKIKSAMIIIMLLKKRIL